jgi:hypothetical protein
MGKATRIQPRKARESPPRNRISGRSSNSKCSGSMSSSSGSGSSSDSISGSRSSSCIGSIRSINISSSSQNNCPLWSRTPSRGRHECGTPGKRILAGPPHGPASPSALQRASTRRHLMLIYSSIETAYCWTFKKVPESKGSCSKRPRRDFENPIKMQIKLSSGSN